MEIFTVDSVIRGRLRGLRQQAEVRDEEGRLLGLFTPLDESSDEVEYFPMPISREEIDRRKKLDGPKRTTREVFEYLLSISQDETLKDNLRGHISTLEQRDKCGIK